MKYLLIFLLVLVIFVISVTLGAHNDQVVNFNYLVAQGDYRVSTLLATLFGAGFVLGWIICGLFYLRTRIALAAPSARSKGWSCSLSSPLNRRLSPLSARNNPSMLELLFLLLPVAAAYGWYMGRRSAQQDKQQEANRLSREYVAG